MAIIDRDLIGDAKNIYLIGIGGVGMSALARVLKHRGLQVTGSDAKESARTQELKQLGIPVFIGQKEINFSGTDLVIYSSAIRTQHLELSAAVKMGVRVHHRAEILSSLLNQAKTSVAVTGSHGKTTTSSMISFVLSKLDRRPTCLVGGDVLNFKTNTILGESNLWISEVDESDQTHELYAPNYAILTNLEEDHVDHYKDLEALRQSFAVFLDNLRNPGMAIYGSDDASLDQLVRQSGKPKISFGVHESADFFASNIQMTPFGSEFDVLEFGFFSAHIKLNVPGMHNILNALASYALLSQLGLDPEAIAGALSEFCGAGRRLEVKYQSPYLTIIDDYAHHPTEVRASIRALKNTNKKVTAIFQPHRFSRTRYFYKEFALALTAADEILLTDIYGAGEPNPDQIDVLWIFREALALGHRNVRYLSKSDLIPFLINRSYTDDLLAFIGAGDIGELADEFAHRYQSLSAA